MLDRIGPKRPRVDPSFDTPTLSLPTLQRPSDLSAWLRKGEIRPRHTSLAVIGEPQADTLHRTGSAPQPGSSCNDVGLDPADLADAISRLLATPGTTSPAYSRSAAASSSYVLLKILAAGSGT